MKKICSLFACALICCVQMVSQTIAEVNYFSNNSDLGGDVVIKKNEIIIEGNNAIISFEVEVPVAGEYYANFWMFPTRLKDGSYYNYSVSVNGCILRDRIEPTIGDWHDITLSGNRKISLNKGINTIAVIGVVPDIPNVEHVKLSLNMQDASIDAAKYNNYKLAAKRASIEYSRGISSVIPYSGVDTLSFNPIYRINTQTSTSDNPLYNYKYALGLIIRYTFYKKVHFTKGELITISTSGIDNFPYVLEFFNAANPNNHSKSYVAYDNNLMSLTDTIPETGNYYVRVRSYKNGHRGLCNLNINNINYYDSIPIYSIGVRCKYEKNKIYNTFTSNNTSDPFIWIGEGFDIPEKIFFCNDNYSISGGNFYWGQNARIKRFFTRETHTVLLSCAYSSNPDGRCDLYMKCKNNGTMADFPNLKADDAIQSAPQTSQYNCISWSGGITSYWEWPLDTLSSYYSPNPLVAFDNFYASRGLTRIGATANNGVVALWASVDAFGNREYTHASVKRGADNNLHGYDWESKAGANVRLFHPRDDLNGPSYGQIVEYYIKSPSSLSSSRTIEEEIADGTARIEYVNLTADEKDYLQNNIQAVDTSIKRQFDTVYDRWRRVAENSVCSNPKQLSNCQEYRDVLALCNSHRELLYSIYDKVGKGEFVATILVADLTFNSNSTIIKSVRESSITSDNRSDVKTIRPLLSNYVAYIKELLALENENLVKARKRTSMGDLSYSNFNDFKVTSSHIEFFLDKPATISLSFLDLSGRTISTFIDKALKDSGNYSFILPEIKNDVYLVQLVVDGRVNVKKVYRDL